MLFLQVSKSSCFLVFSATSHQIISTVAPLLCLSSATTQLHFRMWARKMAVHGNTATPPPPNPPLILLWDFNFMVRERKGNWGFRVHTRKVWECFLAGDIHPAQEWCKKWHMVTLLNQYFPASVSHSPVENLKKAFISLWLPVWDRSGAQILQLYFDAYMKHMTPLPPNPQHPKHNAMLEEKLGQSAVKPKRANNPWKTYCQSYLKSRD